MASNSQDTSFGSASEDDQDELISCQALRSESQPINAQPNGRVSLRPLLSLLAIFALDRCSYYNYMSILTNAGNPGHKYCGAFMSDNATDPWQATIKLQIQHSSSFLLPLIGGFLADQIFGCARMLTICGVVYHIAAWLLVALLYWPAICCSGLASVCKILLVLTSGLLRPSLLVLTIESGSPIYSVTHICQLYYICEAFGQVLGYLLAFGSDQLQFPLGFLCVPTTFLLMLLSVLCVSERPGWSRYQFTLPGWPRFKRTIIIAEPLIAQATAVILGYFTLSVYEVNKLSKSQGLTPTQFKLKRDFLLLSYSVTLVVAMAILMLLTRLFTATMSSPDVRILIGIAATSFAHLVAPSVSLFSPHASLWIIAVFLNFLYAIGEAFAISTANEVAYRSGFAESRTFWIGLYMGFWGSGYVFSIIAELSHMDALNLHLFFGVLLMIAFVFFVCFAMRALNWLLYGNR